MTRDAFDPLDDEPKPEIDPELAEEPEFELQEDIATPDAPGDSDWEAAESMVVEGLSSMGTRMEC